MTRERPTSLMLFAAGLGTRMGTLTANRPKPLIPVAGKALIDHALGWVDGAGVESVVVNLHYKSGMLRTHLANRNLTFSDETGMILNTGGGLRQALPLLGRGPVFTFNPDAIWAGPNPLRLLAAAWRPEDMDALLLLIPPIRARGHRGVGDFVPDKAGRITRGPGLIYSGAQIICTERLSEIREKAFSLNLLWDRLVASGRACGLTYRGRWCDVGRPEGIGLAEAMLNGARDV